MSELTIPARDYWAWMAQDQYKKIINNSNHLREELRPYHELYQIHILNEYTWKIKGFSFNAQIKYNKIAKMIDPSLPVPQERYPFYDFENKFFTEERLSQNADLESANYEKFEKSPYVYECEICHQRKLKEAFKDVELSRICNECKR